MIPKIHNDYFPKQQSPNGLRKGSILSERGSDFLYIIQTSFKIQNRESSCDDE
jgi:hypothetical protein